MDREKCGSGLVCCFYSVQHKIALPDADSTETQPRKTPNEIQTQIHTVPRCLCLSLSLTHTRKKKKLILQGETCSWPVQLTSMSIFISKATCVQELWLAPARRKL